MALKETVNELQALLECVTKDLEKGNKGNKAASQRVRTGTVKLEKIAKLYRKQSVAFEKTVKSKASAPKAAAKKKAAPKKSPKRKAK
jgi:DNA-binding protein H-NS